MGRDRYQLESVAVSGIVAILAYLLLQRVIALPAITIIVIALVVAAGVYTALTREM
jgi:VIT1/CCC1 family predicted Fe2+/Mn2+ transporter